MEPTPNYSKVNVNNPNDISTICENDKLAYSKYLLFTDIRVCIVTETYPRNYISIFNGTLPKLPSTVVEWVVELLHRCLQVSPSNRPTFNEIFEILKSRNFDLFKTNSTTRSTKKQNKTKSQRELIAESSKSPHSNINILTNYNKSFLFINLCVSICQFFD